ncbi:UbiA family prenyltransferase [Flexivirga alba]|uniref:UbiA family prenyltransferase n=1 Tax=Flexivirga alba TaxID=702742 RepID=A0ABW2AJS9_9MICO
MPLRQPLDKCSGDWDIATRDALVADHPVGLATRFGGTLLRALGLGTSASTTARGKRWKFSTGRPRRPIEEARELRGLLKACHPGPSLAVTVLASAYGVSIGLPASRIALVAATVLTGQLSIGWSNDLIDVNRDRATARRDKPFATGELSIRAGRVACAVTAIGTVVLSLGNGIGFSEVYLPCVAAGWSYNLGMKGTVLSWLPYAVAFGGLPVSVALAGGATSPWWVAVAGALLGVGAHLMNVLPDLADDEATGIHGLAHRLGARRTSLLAVTSLLAASVLLLLIEARTEPVAAGAVAAVVAVLAGLAMVSDGKTPFYAAMGIAVADVGLLLVAG